MFQVRYVADIARFQKVLDKFLEECPIIPILNTEDLINQGLVIPMTKKYKDGKIKTINMEEINIDILMALIKQAIIDKTPLQLNNNNIRLINPN
jgi:50S ribosomal subunit-associated GTPase HflX